MKFRLLLRQEAEIPDESSCLSSRETPKYTRAMNLISDDGMLRAMGSTYMDFSTGIFHVDGDAPLTQEQVDSVWRHLPTTGASWVERGKLFAQQFDGAPAFDLGTVERGVKGVSDKVRFGEQLKRQHAAKKKTPAWKLQREINEALDKAANGWLLQLKGRPYYWSRDGQWQKDIAKAKHFRSEHEALAMSNQLHGAVVIPAGDATG